MWIKDKIKRVVTGTPFERVARRSFKWFQGRFLEDPVNARYNRETVAVMKRVLDRDSSCVDVGSSIGDILMDMERIAPEGTHYAFEPIPENYHRLQRSFPKARVYKVALFDEKGTTTFQHVESNAGYSGLKRREYPAEKMEIQEIEVQTDLLDDIVSKDVQLDFIKIDVEGAELQVLKGARATIRRCRPSIVFEHQLGAADFYGTTPEALYDFLYEECDSNISLMKSWLKGGPSLERREFSRQFYERENYYFIAHPRRSAHRESRS